MVTWSLELWTVELYGFRNIGVFWIYWPLGHGLVNIGFVDSRGLEI